MGRTKKVGTAGRFGARGGTRARKAIALIEKNQKKWQKCPSCGQTRVKRVSVGIWQCRKCSHKFAGGAYLAG
jgi:large subunit ribosomal protein L37Ae